MRIPSYRKHSRRDKGFCEFRRQRHYFPGRYNSPESQAAYREFVRAHVLGDTPLAGDIKPLPPQPVAGQRIAVAELVYWFSEFTKQHYPGDKSERHNFKSVLLLLAEQFAETPVDKFGPRALQEFRQFLVDSQPIKKGVEKRSRGYVNGMIRRVRQLFKWGVSRELVAIDVYQSLLTLEPLRKGRTSAPDHAPREPVSWEQISATLFELNPVVADMVRVHSLTGARSQSIVFAKPLQFARGRDGVLIWKPRHKQEAAGQQLIIPIGPRTEDVLSPYLAKSRDAFMFDPRAAGESDRYTERYTSSTYRQAVVRAAERASVRKWTPHQLRHTRGTEVRQRFGLEAAQAALGHGHIDTTQIYSSKQLETAKMVAREMG